MFLDQRGQSHNGKERQEMMYYSKKTINGLRQSYREKLNDSIKCSVSNNLSRNIMWKGCAKWVAF